MPRCANSNAGSRAGIWRVKPRGLFPARAGPVNQIHVYVLSSLGTPKVIPELDASLSLPAQNLGPLSIPLVFGGLGHYYAANVDIPVAGTWTLKFTVRTDAIDEQVVSETLPVH